MTELDALDALDGTAQARLISSGEIAPAELLEQTIRAIERLDPVVHAIESRRFDAARRECDARTGTAFGGVPILLKDLGATAEGEPSTGGFAQLRSITASRTSYIVESLEAAGFVRIGRTSVPELASSPTTENSGRPPVRNPWDLTKSAGGSSGGSAAAVAAGMVAIAHGSDGGGSIRIPASACGLVGLKATRGRVSAGPDAGEGWAGAAVDGVLTRTVRDTAGAMHVLSTVRLGEPYYPPPLRIDLLSALTTPPPSLRIGFTTDVFEYGSPAHPDCVEATEAAAELLESLGHHVERHHPRAVFEAEFEERFDVIVAAEAVNSLAALERTLARPVSPAELEPRNAALWERGKRISVEHYLESRYWLQTWARRVADWWAEFDLLVTPTVAAPPPPIGWFSEAGPEIEKRRIEDYHPYSGQFNVTGQPAISLPLGRSHSGLPIGVQLVAAYGQDDLLIQVAAQLELAAPWMHAPLSKSS